ncbi:MAG TPA: HD-GYP domain-containing protein [Vicinamibacterales bacterium]|jgi:putative nucleotidyltransferase with HDIG domain
MTERRRRPPRLLFRTLVVTFSTMAALLVVVLVVVTVTVRNQVRQAVAANLESSQRMFAALETRRQHEMKSQAATIADSPTLVAAIDTIQLESRSHPESANAEALETIRRELMKVGSRVDADAIVLVDARGSTMAATGRYADRWPRGRPVSIAQAGDHTTFDGIAREGDTLFRLVAVPLQLPDAVVGTLYLATVLDRSFAESLDRLSGARTAVVSEGLLTTSTLRDADARQFEPLIATRPVEGTVVLNGESFAFRRLVAVGDTMFYALSSVDESSRVALAGTMNSLAVLSVAALALALLGSFALARQFTKPIDRLSTSLASMAATREGARAIPLTGSSREVDALTETFNALMASVAEAEAETEAAYTGAIRALATALDARDPYTAGHSERVSVLSVAIGEAMNLSVDDLEVLRLGALLHDIGKIGVPDAVLMKPGPLTDEEFHSIKQHPVLGARILRSVPFLSRHIPIVELHHERPDGRGYPLGLRGDDIPLAARIVHVADAYDAITSARAYRGARPPSAALHELWRLAGTEFHAEVVGALARALPRVTSDAGYAIAEHG